MGDQTRTWKVKVQNRSVRGASYIYLMIFAFVVVLGLIRIGIPQQYVSILGIGVFFLVVAVGVFITLTQLTGRFGELELGSTRVMLRCRKSSREFVLSRCRAELSKHFSAENYRFFIGSLLTFTDKESGDQLRILGGGVELQATEYTDNAETYGANQDLIMTGPLFRELLSALQPGLLRQGNKDKVQPELGREGGWSPEESLVFEALPVWNFAGKSMVVWLFGITTVGLAGSMLIQGPGKELVAEYGIWMLSIFLLPLLFLVGFIATRQRAERCTVQLDPSRLTIFNRGRVQATLTPPFKKLELGDFHVRSRYRTYYCGPAIRLVDGGDQRVTLGISNDSLGWAQPSRRMRRVSYMLSEDAGKALVRWLGSVETRNPPTLVGRVVVPDLDVEE